MRDARYFDEAVLAGERTRLGDAVSGGVAGGLIAGVAMLLWAMISAAVADLGGTRPLELTGATFVGREGMEDAPALLLGALLWAAVSAALGLLFAALIPRDFPFVSAAVLGVGYAYVILALMSSVVLPRVNPTMRAEMPEMGGAWVLAYSVFGIALGLVPPIRRRLAARTRR